jgi:hypothetical protein
MLLKISKDQRGRKEKGDDSRRQSVPCFCNSGRGFLVDGERGAKVTSEEARHQVNIEGTVKIIPSIGRAPLPPAPQDQNS